MNNLLSQEDILKIETNILNINDRIFLFSHLHEIEKDNWTIHFCLIEDLIKLKSIYQKWLNTLPSNLRTKILEIILEEHTNNLNFNKYF